MTYFIDTNDARNQILMSLLNERNQITEKFSFETLEKIADYFNVDTDFLLGRTNQTTILPETIGKYSKTRELDIIYEQLSVHNQNKVLTYSKNLLSTQQMEEDLLAAHVRTDVEATPEGQKQDIDIMNDDSKW